MLCTCGLWHPAFNGFFDKHATLFLRKQANSLWRCWLCLPAPAAWIMHCWIAYSSAFTMASDGLVAEMRIEAIEGDAAASLILQHHMSHKPFHEQRARFKNARTSLVSPIAKAFGIQDSFGVVDHFFRSKWFNCKGFQKFGSQGLIAKVPRKVW